mgnify:FL=1
MLRVCVIGVGPIGNRHADIYMENELSQLVGICDIDETRANATAERLSVSAFYNAKKMLEELKSEVL